MEEIQNDPQKPNDPEEPMLTESQQQELPETTAESSSTDATEADSCLPGRLGELKRILEAALLAAQQPLSVSELRRMFTEEIGPDVVRKLLDELRDEWSG